LACGVGLSVLLAILVGRALGVEQSGVYYFFISLLTFTYLLISQGLPSLMLRESALADTKVDAQSW